MIYSTNLKNWNDLQENVCSLLCEVGISAETNKVINTPRGKTNIDVYGIDSKSVDQISYIVECKFWNKNIPQTVVHSFTTVMSETGGNIGYIISNKGFQKGAIEYLKNTNIIGLTFLDFQKKYFPIWFKNYFAKVIYEAVDSLIQYTEPINSIRHRYSSQLPHSKVYKFTKLFGEYENYAFFLSLVGFSSRNGLVIGHNKIPIENYIDFKQALETVSKHKFKSDCYKDLLNEIIIDIKKITMKFNKIFGKDIFQD